MLKRMLDLYLLLTLLPDCCPLCRSSDLNSVTAACHFSPAAQVLHSRHASLRSHIFASPLSMPSLQGWRPVQKAAQQLQRRKLLSRRMQWRKWCDLTPPRVATCSWGAVEFPPPAPFPSRWLPALEHMLANP